MRESSSTETNPLRRMQGLGQSVWIDTISRDLILSGELARLIDEDGVSGVMSNPSLFEKAIDGGHDYDAAIRVLSMEGRGVTEMYETLVLDDIQHAADILRPAYDRTDGVEGFVSLEVSPHLAHDTAGTVNEARRLWECAARPNVMIKVPATAEGLPAIRTLIGEGINVNITLLFGLSRYREVIDAYIGGLEERVKRRLPLKEVVSVASFFLSRLDAAVDPMIDRLRPGDELRAALRGRTAIASARLAYRIYRDVFSGDRFRRYAARDAHTQRLLWASMGTRDPLAPDVAYVEPLIGPGTISTLPLGTLRAYRHHGAPHTTLTGDLEESRDVLYRVSQLGVDLEDVRLTLESEGVKKFREAFTLLLETIARKSAQPGTAAAGARGETRDRERRRG